MDKKRRFGGVERLYDPDVLNRLDKAHVCVIGVGGVGSWAVEALARSGIGEITLIDMDHVAESNINRQLPALEDTLGQSKIAVMRERLALINPECRCNLVDDFITRDNIQDLIDANMDWVLDCIDSFRVKSALIYHCRRNKIPVITTGGAGGKLDPGKIQVSDLSRTEQDALLAKTRRDLRQNFGFPANPKRRFGIPAVWSSEPARHGAHEPVHCEPGNKLNCGGYGSLMPVTASVGLFAAAFVLNEIGSSN